MFSTSQVPANRLSRNLEYNSDSVDKEHDASSKELTLSDLKLIREFRWQANAIPILKALRKLVESRSKVPNNREEYFRTKLQQEYPKLYHLVLENISTEGKELASPEKIKEIAEIFIQIAGGFHNKFYLTLNTESLNVRLTKFRNKPTAPSYPGEFHKFQQLPPELRTMIWNFAVWAQDRFVDTYRLRRIKSAPCPVLFLTCKEAKFWAIRQYKRVKNGDLLYGKIVPASRKATGPVISFEHDIVMMGDWRLWNAPRNSPRRAYPREVAELQSRGLPLRHIHKRIEVLSARGFHRVALSRPHQVHPELIFYKDSRRRFTNFPKYGGANDWGWGWTHCLEEVWTIDRVQNYIDQTITKHVARVFPPVPGDDCSCTLCERADMMIGEELSYKKPEPQDLKEHERIFKVVDPQYYWGVTYNRPQGLNDV
ncbi:hypothetical protein F4814DRAFT_450349 [Daldinia grandis]|nr:hypothetical protein F4814DRAFT_450349 [Daldinia grandis]